MEMKSSQTLLLLALVILSLSGSYIDIQPALRLITTKALKT